MTLTNNKYDSRGYIFDIQGLSVHDGPGCRTLIFLCGCTLNCFWCSNPEGINPRHSIMYSDAKCICCGNCIAGCDKGALSLEDGKVKIFRHLCRECESPTCTAECYTNALRISGFEISVEKLFEIIRRDRHFWGDDGGLTLTGGEPLLQFDFAREILARCHQEYIHTAIETCGNIPWENLLGVIPYLDWIFFDLKHFDNKQHKIGTSSENSLILDNAKRLSKEFRGRLIFRLPLLPDYNDSEDNLNSIIAFLKEAGKKEINILPLHHLGKGKYTLLQKNYQGSSYSVPSIETLNNIRAVFMASGIECYMASETPF